MGCRTSQAKSAVITAKAFPTLTTDAIPSRTSPFGALNHAEMNVKNMNISSKVLGKHKHSLFLLVDCFSH